MKIEPSKEYTSEPESRKKELEFIWCTAIGLQRVDGLETSDYLKSLANDHINGKITIEEVEELLKKYYREKSDSNSAKEKANKVAVTTTKTLADKSFVFSLTQFLDLSPSLKRKVSSLVSELSSYEFFGRGEVIKVLTMSPSGASKLISKLLSLEILKPVSGHGKGKYCFNIGIK